MWQHRKYGFVYILTNAGHSVLYVGVTSRLKQRIWQHRTGVAPHSFTARYRCHKLVYWRRFEEIEAAIAEEKRIKGGNRAAKLALIERYNPAWEDLFATLEDDPVW